MSSPHELSKLKESIGGVNDAGGGSLMRTPTPYGSRIARHRKFRFSNLEHSDSEFMPEHPVETFIPRLTRLRIENAASGASPCVPVAARFFVLYGCANKAPLRTR